MAGFDVQAARASGYSDAEIADYLGQQSKFDTASARKAGYSDQELIGHLTGAAPPPAAAPPAAPRPPATFMDTLAGEGEIAGAGIINALKGVPNAAKDIVQRIGGNSNPSPVFQPTPVGAAGQRLIQNVGDMLPEPVPNNMADEIDKIRAQRLQDVSSHIPQPLQDVASSLVEHAAPVAGDVANLAGAGAVARAPIEGILSAVRQSAADAAAPAVAAGFRNAAGATGTAGKVLAGDSAKATLINHNSAVADTIAGAEANVPKGTALGYDSLAAARNDPDAVYARVANELPTGQLDPPARTEIQNAGLPQGGRMSQGSPQAQQQIETLRSQLLDPDRQFTGDQMINELRGLRQEGFANSASDDVSNQQLGRAQLDMARAIEGHVGRALPVGGDVDLAQFQDARKTLAKNFTVQNALRGNSIDPNVLARVQRADPELLDGGLKTIADFANNNREVVGLPTTFGAPSVVKDLSNVSLTRPGTYFPPVTGALGRRMLTGGTDNVLERTNRMFPTQSGRFGPLPSDVPPQPMGPPEPQFTTGIGANPNPTVATGRPGDIPLADLLSHGVEQSPPPGLTAGPMGAPAPHGIPFQVNAEHAAGGLQLGGEPSLADLLTDLRDHPDVMSQGVPEGIMARSGGTVPRGTQPTISFPGGVTSESRLANNASGESAASQEAINRGTRNVVQVGPDGTESPVMRDVTQIDARAPKGNLLVDGSTGEIIDRGGMNQRAAEGLRNRWASMRRLGDNFVSR